MGANEAMVQLQVFSHNGLVECSNPLKQEITKPLPPAYPYASLCLPEVHSVLDAQLNSAAAYFFYDFQGRTQCLI